MSESNLIIEQLEQAKRDFQAHFGRPARFAAVAPGRVNLIGEHTDYNEGFVLPMAIQRQTILLADFATDKSSKVARFYSRQMKSEATFNVDASIAPGEPDWANYVKGVVVGCLNRGMNPGGIDVLLDSTVPLGGGLSSSAALEVATATLIETMTGKKIDGVEKALLCQKAEHDFPKMPCGIMDQFISALGQEGSAMLLDCRSRQTRMVPLKDESIAVLITNSNVKHALVGGEYAERRSKCFEAAKALGVSSLREATMAQLEKAKGSMDATAFVRARHVIGEIARTTQAADAAAAGNWELFGKLMYESHASLRDDFQVSCKELDILVEIARKIGVAGGVLGSRMTGGGFGGCTVSLVRASAIESITQTLKKEYAQATRIEPTIFSSRPAAGAHVLAL